MYVLLLLIVILAISFWYVYIRKQHQYRLPPGPRGLPIIGNIHQLLVKNPYNKFSEWADKYKAIYTINLCGKKAVVINEPKLMQMIFNKFAATGKFQTDAMLLISQGPYGVLSSEGETWSEQRTFCVKKLKEFGFGNKRMETLILSEADEVCKWITNANKDTTRKLLNIQPIFLQSMTNTLWTMVTGTRISLGESKIAELLERFSTTLQDTVKTGLFFLPWMKYLAPKLSGFTAYNTVCQDVLKHIEEEFMDHKKTLMKGAQRDLIDAYIEESNNDPLKRRHAVATVAELFLAASETTGSTLTWLLCYLSVNPDIQAKLHQEIDMVAGENQDISLDLKSKMPYTEAIILETLRMSPVAPMGTVHRLLDDLEIDGYKLPKGLLLIANIYHCHYNKDVWNDPEVFRPQRFLDDQENKLKGHLIPFQLGRRQCVGEPLAKDILFIFVTRIFQLFDVYPDKNVKTEDYYKPDIGFFLLPSSTSFIIKPRRK